MAAGLQTEVLDSVLLECTLVRSDVQHDADEQIWQSWVQVAGVSSQRHGLLNG